MKRYFENDLSIPSADIARKPKHKFTADAVLLVFICFFVLLGLTTLTCLKFGSENVLVGEAAFAEQSAAADSGIHSVDVPVEGQALVWVMEDGVTKEYEPGDKEGLQYIHREPIKEALEYGVDLKYDENTRLLQIDYTAHDDEGNIIYNSQTMETI